MSIKAGEFTERSQELKQFTETYGKILHEIEFLDKHMSDAISSLGKNKEEVDKKLAKLALGSGSIFKPINTKVITSTRQYIEALKEVETIAKKNLSIMGELKEKTGIQSDEELKDLITNTEAINNKIKSLEKLKDIDKIEEKKRNSDTLREEIDEIKEKIKYHTQFNVTQKELIKYREELKVKEGQLKQNKLTDEDLVNLNKKKTLEKEIQDIKNAEDKPDASDEYKNAISKNSADISALISQKQQNEKEAKDAEDRANKSKAEQERQQNAAQEKLDKRIKNWGDIKEFGGGLFSIFKQFFMLNAEAEDKAFKTGRAVGFNLQQTQGYFRQVQQDMINIGGRFGMTGDEIQKMQGRVFEATGRAVVMNDKQTEAFAGTTKAFGEDITDAAVKSMDKMGGGIVQASSMLNIAQKQARYYGLDASKMAKALTENLDYAQKNLTFKDGVNGIARMTSLSESLKINMQSVMASADKMNNVQGVVEAAAKLQMLGGAFAQNFSDPLRVMYEAQSDPEALLKRVVNSAEGSSTFNMKTGLAATNYQGRASLKAASEALGIPYDDLLQASQSQAKLEALGSQMNSNLSQDQKLAIANRAQLDENGQYRVSYYDDKGDRKSKLLGEMTESDIKKMTADAEKEKDINGNVYAISDYLGKDQKEIIGGIKTILEGKIMKAFQNLTTWIGKHGDRIIEFFQKIPTWLAIALGGFVFARGPAMAITRVAGKTLFKQVGKVFGHFAKTSERAGLGDAAKELGLGASVVENPKVDNTVVKNNPIKSVFGKIKNRILNVGVEKKVTEETGEQLTKGIGKNIGKKLLRGAGIGVAMGAYDLFSTFNDYEKAKSDMVYGGKYSKDKLLSDSNSDKDKQMQDIAKLTSIEKAKSQGIGGAIGGTVGGILGELIPGLQFGGGILGSIAGNALGGAIGKMFAKKSSTITHEEQGKTRAKSYFYETSKFGESTFDAYKNDPVAQATIKSSDILASIYQILSSKFDKGMDKQLNMEIAKASGNKEAIKDAEKDMNRKWYKPWTLFSDGGIIKAANGYSPYSGDHIHIRANAGEMVLNENEQNVVSALINKPYSSKTKFLRSRDSSVQSSEQISHSGNFNINLNGTLNLNSNGRQINMAELMNDAQFKRQLADMIIEQMSRNNGGKSNRNDLNYKESSFNARTRMYNVSA